MLYLLDTDTCSYIIRQRPLSVLTRMEAQLQAGHEIAISSITYAELLLGAKCSNPNKHLPLIHELCERLHTIYAWDAQVAASFADLQTELLNAGTPIGANDTLIAAHALSLSATLVSNNTKHFGKITQLKLVNWVGD